MSNVPFGSGKSRFVGRGVDVDLNQLDPAAYEGTVVYSDGELYYSNGSDWLVPQDQTDISRPRALYPTTSIEAAQLRLTPFNSPTGETQTGIFFQVSLTSDFTTPLFTRTVNSTSASLYQLIYPDDGLNPGDVIWWRARYAGTNGTQSAYSLPISQQYPQLQDNPMPITLSGAVTNTLEITPYVSAFGLNYVETNVEVYDSTGVSLITAFTVVTGGTIAVPVSLTEGVSYQWRARYGGRSGLSGPILRTEWTTLRSFLNGARSMVLVFNPALAVSRTINLPLGMHLPTGGVCNVTVDWGDGSTNTYTTGGNRTKTYAVGVTGLVTVVVTGQLTQYGGNVNQAGLVSVNSIGFSLGLTSLYRAFANTGANLTYIYPKLPPSVTNLSELFYAATPAADITQLDVQYATNISGMFTLSGVAQNLSGWDTSNVQNMEYLFNGSTASPGPNCAGWDVSSVTNVYRVCWGNSQFNNAFTLGNWDSLTSMQEMFAVQAGTDFRVRFNQPINYWDVSNVTNMSGMFGIQPTGSGINRFNDFNQPLDQWDVSNVTNMSGMFGVNSTTAGYGYVAFNQDISGWDVSNVVNMSHMFRRQTTSVDGGPFNQPIGVWDVSSCIDFSFMFAGAAFNRPLSGWTLSTDPAKSINLSGMFAGNQVFNSDVSGWNTTRVTNMSSMFSYAFAFNQSLNTWDVSNVTNMSNMFNSAMAFNQPLGSWNVSNVTNMRLMFACEARPGGNYTFNQPLNSWNVSNVTDMSRMFYGGGGGGTFMTHLFNQPLNNWNVSNVQNMEAMFASSTSTFHATSFDQDISEWNIRVGGVDLTNFLFGAAVGMSNANYSKLLAGWAGRVNQQNGPYAVSAGFGGKKYDTTVRLPGTRFETGAQGRAYLVGANQLSVASAGDANADGTYSLVGGLYTNANDWYFIKVAGVWYLKDDLDATQATQQDVADRAAPQYVTTWNGDLSAATVLRTGAVWTITDGGPV